MIQAMSEQLGCFAKRSWINVVTILIGTIFHDLCAVGGGIA
jgi:hypothetical protein